MGNSANVLLFIAQSVYTFDSSKWSGHMVLVYIYYFKSVIAGRVAIDVNQLVCTVGVRLDR